MVQRKMALTYHCLLFAVLATVDGGTPRVMLRRFSSSYELGQTYRDGTTALSIGLIVRPDPSSDPITGQRLWKLRLFGSSNDDGSGTICPVSPQILRPPDSNHPLNPNQDMEFDITNNVDLRAIGNDTDCPYLCVEFGKDPTASPHYHLEIGSGGTDLMCHEVHVTGETNGHGGPDHGGPGDGGPGDGDPGLSGRGHGGGDGRQGDGGGNEPDKPDAIFNRFSAGVSSSAIPDSHLTRVEVAAIATPHDQTDYVPAAEFRLGMFGSNRPDGSVRVNEVRHLLPRGYTHPVYRGRQVVMDVISDVDLRGIGVGTGYPYLCVEFDRENDHVDFDMPSGSMVACSHYTAPVPEETHPMEPDPDRPQAYVSNLRTSLRFSQVRGSKLIETTVDMEMTSHSSADYIPRGTNWRLGIFGNPEEDGSGRRKKEVRQLLSRDQQRYSWAPGETINFEAVEQLDLNGIGTGTNNPYLCLELDKVNDHVNFDMPQGSMVSCSELDNPGPHTGPEPGPEPGPPDERPIVIVKSVTPDKGVKPSEKAATDITFDVVVAVDPSSGQVHGSNLWKLTVYASKMKNGEGPRLGEVEQVLSPEQQSQTIQKRKKISFRDVSMTMDLTGVKCKDVKYLCAELMKGTGANFELVKISVIGCQKMKCAKKNKKGKPSIAKGGTTLTINSIRPSRVSIFSGNLYSVGFRAPIEFDASQSEPLTRGINLWKMSAWFNKDPSDSKQNALVEQILRRNKKSKYVTDPSSIFSFGRFEVEMDLRGLNCRKLKYFCVKITPDDPQPAFTLAKATEDSNIGCSRTTCR